MIQKIQKANLQEFLELDKRGDLLEYINGEVFRVCHTSQEHQRVIINVKMVFNRYFEQKPYKVFTTPFAIWLKENEIKVCPDVAIIYDRRGLLGGIPKMIVEVMDYHNQSHDRLTKYVAYMNAGVREYWIINPKLRIVEIYILNANDYEPVAILKGSEDATSECFPGLSVSLSEIFE